MPRWPCGNGSVHMRGFVCCLLVVSLLVSAAVLPVGADSEDPQARDYVGVSYHGSEAEEGCDQLYRQLFKEGDCGLFRDMVFSVCDDPGGIAGLGVDGLGEVRFCDVAPESEVRVRIEDDILPDSSILVTCRAAYEPAEPIIPVWPFTYYTWYEELGVGEPDFQGTVSPEECIFGGHGGVLRVFVLEGVAGTIELEYL